METSNKDLSNYYNSYGPLVGKVCENTNNFMNVNFLEKTKSHHELIENLPNKHIGGKESYGKKSKLSGGSTNVSFVPEQNKTIKISKKSHSNSSSENIAGVMSDFSETSVSNPLPKPKQIKTNINSAPTHSAPTLAPTLAPTPVPAPSVSVPTSVPVHSTPLVVPVPPAVSINPEVQTNAEVDPAESVSGIKKITGYFLGTVSIFGYEISVWMLILIIIVVFCVGYFVYKYIFCKNKILTVENKPINSPNFAKSSKPNANTDSDSGSDSGSDSDSDSKSSKSSESSNSSDSKSSSKLSKNKK